MRWGRTKAPTALEQLRAEVDALSMRVVANLRREMEQIRYDLDDLYGRLDGVEIRVIREDDPDLAFRLIDNHARVHHPSGQDR